MISMMLMAMVAAKDAALHACAHAYAALLNWLARQLLHLAEFLSDGADEIGGAE